jgi:pyruvate/2-oxoglutarate dehydrogenase complex dihydrolipoamide acyltransferase (E2) component
VRAAVALPDLGAARATFSLWHVRPGDRVYEGDRVAEVLIPGAAVDVHAPADGVLAEQAAFPQDVVSAGQVLGWIEAES